MRIVLFGCGRIGTCILNLLSTSEHEIIVIDTKEAVIEKLASTRKLQAVCADATSFHVLEDVDVKDADVVISCTNINEINLAVCHMAKTLGAKHTIAQIRKPDYSTSDLYRVEEMFGVDFVYSPDLVAASAIYDIIDPATTMHLKRYLPPKVMLMGASRICVHLCRLLIKANCEVKVLEKDYDKCQSLSELVPTSVNISCADGTDRTVLFEEGIERTDAFVALTNIDEQNLLISVYAESRKVPTVVTKVKQNNFEDLVDNLELKNIIAPKQIAAERVVNYIEELAVAGN